MPSDTQEQGCATHSAADRPGNNRTPRTTSDITRNGKLYTANRIYSPVCGDQLRSPRRTKRCPKYERFWQSVSPMSIRYLDWNRILG